MLQVPESHPAIQCFHKILFVLRLFSDLCCAGKISHKELVWVVAWSQSCFDNCKNKVWILYDDFDFCPVGYELSVSFAALVFCRFSNHILANSVNVFSNCSFASRFVSSVAALCKKFRFGSANLWFQWHHYYGSSNVEMKPPQAIHRLQCHVTADSLVLLHYSSFVYFYFNIFVTHFCFMHIQCATAP